jgi:hypothetical protein
MHGVTTIKLTKSNKISFEKYFIDTLYINSDEIFLTLIVNDNCDEICFISNFFIEILTK